VERIKSRGDSLLWTIQECSAHKGYLLGLQEWESGSFLRLEVCVRGAFSGKGM